MSRSSDPKKSPLQQIAELAGLCHFELKRDIEKALNIKPHKLEHLSLADLRKVFALYAKKIMSQSHKPKSHHH